MPNDAIPGARFEDTTLGKEGVISGVYEATDFDDGEPVGTSVYVDLLYDGREDPVRVEVSVFREDGGIEVKEIPDGI